jgi:ATP-dependent Zn protease
MNSRSRKLTSFGVLFVSAGLLWAITGQKHSQAKRSTYSEFVQQVDTGKVKDAVISVSNGGASPVIYSLQDGTKAEAVLPREYKDILAAMQQKMVNIEFRDAGSQRYRIIANSAPFLILLAFWFGMMQKLRGWGAHSPQNRG